MYKYLLMNDFGGSLKEKGACAALFLKQLHPLGATDL